MMSESFRQASTVILVPHNGMGHAEGDLPQTLAVKYFHLLNDSGMLPGAICFYTDGVKLVCEGSPALAELQALADSAVHLIVCGTCLNYFGLKDKVEVGIVGGMTDIIDAQWRADKMITL